MTIVPNSGPLICGRFGHLRSLTDAFGVSIAKLGAGAHSDEQSTPPAPVGRSCRLSWPESRGSGARRG
jgi:hypothetical protein